MAAIGIYVPEPLTDLFRRQHSGTMRYPARAQGAPKIGGDVVPRPPRDDGKAENLIDDLQDTRDV